MREQTGGGRQVFVSTHERPDARDTPVIDLDATREQPALPEPSRQWRGRQSLRSRHVPLPLVLALLVGTAAVAAGGNYRWQTRQQRLADESVANVLVLGQTEISGAERDGPLARVKSSVIVVNSGPLPVEVTDIRTVTASLALSSVSSDVVRPGVRWFTVWVTVNCTIAVANESVPVVISVRTADGKLRELSFQVPPRPWQYAFESMCLPPPGFRGLRPGS